jgi:hypothetical protein
MGAPRCPSWMWFRERFGSVNAAVVAAGLVPNQSGTQIAAERRRQLAERITRDKQAWWANGGKDRSSWVHPYARRSA